MSNATVVIPYKPHTVQQYAQVFRNLLPPGGAWEWPEGGTGDALLKGMAVEFTRIEAAVPALMQSAIGMHTPKNSQWRIADYQAEADKSQEGIVESLPRKPFAAGSHAGDRLWGTPVPSFPVPLVQVSQARPFSAGSRCGDALWGTRGRYIVIVRYYHGVVNFAKLLAALQAFKLAHTVLFFQDITHWGGEFVDL